VKNFTSHAILFGWSDAGARIGDALVAEGASDASSSGPDRFSRDEGVAPTTLGDAASQLP